MKKYLLATTILFAPLVANAADLAPVYRKAPVPVAAPIFTWTGFYLGVNAGIGGDQVDYPFAGDIFRTPFSGNIGMQSFGGFGGIQGGYNYQFAGGWVVGAEADIQYSNIRSNLNGNASAPAIPLNIGLDAGTEVKWFGSVRGRLGYAFDRILLYGTGGWAFGNEDTSLNVNPTILNFSRNASLNGWVAGGGLEYAMTQNLSFKTEYLYYDFGRNNVWTAAGAPSPFVIDNHITMHTLKAGLNFSFR